MIQFPVVGFLSVNSSIPCSSNKLKKQRNPHSKTHSLIFSVVPSRSHSNSTTHIRSQHHPCSTHLEARLPCPRNPHNNPRTIILPFSSSLNLVNNNSNSHLWCRINLSSSSNHSCSSNTRNNTKQCSSRKTRLLILIWCSKLKRCKSLDKYKLMMLTLLCLEWIHSLLMISKTTMHVRTRWTDKAQANLHYHQC